MKVLFCTRPTIDSDPGGDTIQMRRTAQGLEALGVQIDWWKTDSSKPEFGDYDVVHYFNMIEPIPLLPHLKELQEQKVPLVLSTIFLDYSEFDARDRYADWRRFIPRLLGRDGMQYAKAVGRWLLKGGVNPGVEYLTCGHAHAVKKLLQASAIWLPNSHSEQQRVEVAYHLRKPYRVIPNAVSVDRIVSARQRPDTRYKDYIVCAGRIEGRKNQLRLIRAANQLKLPLLIIGKPATYAPGYYEKCIAEAGPTVQFAGRLPSDDSVYEIMAAARVHSMVSFFETTGLSTLEAAACGARIVISDRGDQLEYFGTDAFYADPYSEDSIAEALQKAWDAPPPTQLAERIVSKLTWEEAARCTYEAYLQALAPTSADTAG